MDVFLLPVLLTVFVWWFSTGAVLYLTGLSPASRRWSLAVAGLCACAGLGAIYATRTASGASAAYLSFLAAMAIWAFNEMAFLFGKVTGGNTAPCPEGATGFHRFRLASQSLMHHEIMLALSGLLIILLCWGTANQTAGITFAALWLMRLSTKLNIFLGVPNITTHFLPVHLAYLASYFRNRPMNGLLPFSVTFATLATVWFGWKARTAAAAGIDATGFALVTAIIFLGLLEHWFLVVPLPFDKLWNWGLRSRAAPSAAMTSERFSNTRSVGSSDRLASDAVTVGQP